MRYVEGLPSGVLGRRHGNEENAVDDVFDDCVNRHFGVVHVVHSTQHPIECIACTVELLQGKSSHFVSRGRRFIYKAMVDVSMTNSLRVQPTRIQGLDEFIHGGIRVIFRH